MNESNGQKVNWGRETLHVLGIVGKVVFRIFSYFLNILLTILLIGLITGIIVGSVFAIYINNNLDLEIDPSSIVTVNRDSATRFYYMNYATEQDRIDRIGTPVEIEDMRLTGKDAAIAISYNQIPLDLYRAFISIEDKRFEKHNGVDWYRTAGAIYYMLTGQPGGGSTITQQLIKNVTGEDEVTIQRKVSEIFRAINLEKVKSKEEIFEAYCNIIYLGNNCTGVQAASNFYFGKDVSQLDLVECAALAAIVKNPSQYEPLYHDKDFEVTKADGTVIMKEGNESRRWYILKEMMKNGYITEAECVQAQNAVLKVIDHSKDYDEEVVEEGITIFSWYIEALFTQLQQDLAEKYNITTRAASLMIYNNGFKIYVPMDPFVQSTLEEIYYNDNEYFPSTGSGLQPQSAMVICDPYTGDVLGTVGGRGKKIMNRGLDRATVATRPPGSAIKPLSVYGPALDAGIITYGTAIDDSPVWFNSYEISPATATSPAVLGYNPYPKNLPDIYNGLTPIHDAVRRSVNTVAMKVLRLYGVDNSFYFMKEKLHFDSLIDSAVLNDGRIITDRGEAALALGQPNYGVRLIEMVSGYCMFQNSGVYNEPNLYLYVTDSEGNMVFDYSDDPQIIISAESASIMTIMMQEVMSAGTGRACTLQNTVDVAGKTGTTSQDFDRYFVGYTPYYVGGVWTGYDMNQSLSAFTENPSLLVWDTVMTRLHQPYVDAAANGGEALKKFEISPGVVTATFCRDSGMLYDDSLCSLDPRAWSVPRSEVGYFTRETVPKQKCTTHVKVQRDASTGGICYPESACSKSNCYNVALIREENRNFPKEVYIVDAQYTFRELPEWTQPSSNKLLPFYANLLQTGQYVGTSVNWGTRPYNSYCVEHGVYKYWTPPGLETEGAETEEETETDEAETDETEEWFEDEPDEGPDEPEEPEEPEEEREPVEPDAPEEPVEP
ncbi:MAG: transglycosylase domain-containing protein [Clostridia bacterium]|nr:transglycosylase domain-containing protein [Clostridia bacterium]